MDGVAGFWTQERRAKFRLDGAVFLGGGPAVVASALYLCFGLCFWYNAHDYLYLSRVGKIFPAHCPSGYSVF